MKAQANRSGVIKPPAWRLGSVVGLLVCGTVVLLLMLLLVACPKKIQQNTPGPGGLPRGVVQEGEESLPEQPVSAQPQSSGTPQPQEGWPLYPGAQQTADDVYRTTAALQEVMDYYVGLLDVQPVVSDESGEPLRFETALYTLVLSPIAESDGGGTEIHFYPKESTSGE